MRSGITINGRHYRSPDEMPPDVRQQYEEALRTIGSALRSSKGSEATEVVTGQPGLDAHTNIVIRRTVTVNGRTFKSTDEMPPELRRLVATGFPARVTTGDASGAEALQAVTDAGRPKFGAFVHVGGATPPPQRLSLEPANVQSKAHDFLSDLVFWVVVGLLVWALLGR